MRNPITRARDFTRRHRTAIAFNAGVIAGGVVVFRVADRIISADDLVIAAPDMLQKLIDEPGGAVKWPRPGRLGDIILANGDNPLLKQ